MRFVKSIIILLAGFFSVAASAQTDTIIINHVKFITVITSTPKTEYGRRDTLLNLYRIENGKRKYLLQHTLYTYGEDCNNEFTDIGSYKIQNDSLVFMTEYKQKTGLDPIPLRQKQIYKVSETGKLTLVFDKVQKRFSGEWVNTKPEK